MQPKNKRKRILRTNASVSGPIKVRNLKTGELAIYTPDRLQPTIPAGWVPLNSSRQQSRNASRNFRRNSGLVVQTCGNQYRILNSSRQVVARGKLNASKETYAVTTVSYTNPEGPSKDQFAHSAEEAYRMVEDYFRDVRESGLIDDEILNIRLRELAAESAANPNEYGVGEDSESPTGYDVFVQRVGDPLDSSRLNANLDEDYDSMMDDMGDFEETVMQRVNEILSERGYWSEPSTQAGRGTDFIYDENDNQVGSINYEDEVRKLNEILQYSEDEEAAAQEMANWMMGFINDENPDNEDF